MIWFLRREIIFCLGIFFSLLIMGREYIRKVDSIENDSYVEKQINYEELVAENIRLRDILDIKQKDRYFSRFAISGIISVNPHVFPVELVINKGWQDGIKEGMSVVSKDFALVGRVFDVSQRTSHVITVFNPKSRISVFADSTKEIGIMEGGSIPYCSLKYINYDSRLEVGDKIITSGYSDFYPKGIDVGEVAKIAKAKDSLFLNIYIKPFSGFSYMDEVLVGE